MKNIISIGVVGLLVLTSLGAAAFSLERQPTIIAESVMISAPFCILQNDESRLELPEATANLRQTGRPLLPMVTKTYTFPFGTTIDSVVVTYGSTKEMVLEKPLQFSPEPRIVSIETIPDANQQIISGQPQDAWYPETSFTYRAGAGIDDDQRVVFLSVHLFPIQYQQTTQTIRYHEEATVTISSTPPAQSANFGNVYTLLILTPSQFTNQLQPLVTYKNDNGIPTVLTTLDAIPHTGKDIQEDIRFYIKYAIETWGITNVILVGAGVEGQELFPVRNAWIASGSYESYFPSDLYYADIYKAGGGLSNWDSDNDGKYAEYPWDVMIADLHPDVYLSRLACNDASEVTAVVNKIIDFKEHNQAMKKILQLGGDTFPGDDEHINEGEYSNTVVMTKLPGYTAIRLWASAATLTKDNIRKNINQGVDFVDCSGHGSWASWATHPPNDDQTWLPPQTFYSPYTGFLYIDVQSFFNSKKYPVFVMNACSTSKFSESENAISWKIVSKSRGGGIASFGASGIGYGMPGTYETEGLWGWMEVRLFQELYTNKVLGKVWANAINGYLNSFFMFEDADYKTILEMTLLGDPTTVIDDGKNPRSHSVSPFMDHPLLHPGSIRMFISMLFAALQQIKDQYHHQ